MDGDVPENTVDELSNILDVVIREMEGDVNGAVCCRPDVMDLTCALRQSHIFVDDFLRGFERLLEEKIGGEVVDIRRVDTRQPVCNFGVPHVGKVGRFIFIRAAANTMPYGGRS